MRCLLCFAALGWLFGGVTSATAHDDIVPYYFDGRLLTGGHDDTTLGNTVVARVFGYDFGEVVEDPYFVGDPGFNNGAFGIGVFPHDGLLPPGETLAFDVSMLLRYWDGTGGVDFATPPAGVSLGLNRGSNTATISGLGVGGVVPTIGSTGTGGRLHVHLGSLLNSADGIDPAEPNAPLGAYLVGLQLKLTDPDSAAGVFSEFSEPIFLVYNNGLSEAAHDEAIDWVQEHLLNVPEPGSLPLTICGATGVAIAAISLRQRRRFHLSATGCRPIEA